MELEKEINAILTKWNRHGFPATYSGAVTGYYMLSR
jgi:hypothetical protein